MADIIAGVGGKGRSAQRLQVGVTGFAMRAGVMAQRKAGLGKTNKRPRNGESRIGVKGADTKINLKRVRKR